MQLISPDVLAEGRGLSQGTAGLLLLGGFLLWAAGWRWHRFWVVFGITLAAGVLGLTAGQQAGGHQVLVVGVLMAVAAGMMALELAKILAFLTGGTAAWVATQTVLPQAQELWAMFLSGGLLGVVLFRLWTMLATSTVGCLLAGHSSLVLIGAIKKFDASAWANKNTAALNGAVVALALIGVIVQARFSPKETEESQEPKDKNAKEADDDSHKSAKEKNPKKASELLIPDEHDSEERDHKSGEKWWKRAMPFHRAA